MVEEKKKVLLVDDVRLFLQLEETFFKRTGCNIFTAGSGNEALEVAHKLRPDLILLDYLMPDMNGDEVCRLLKGKDETSDIPIIIVSTSAKKEDIAKCFEAGADDYVTKPINPQDVLNKAAMMLNIPHRLHRRLIVSFNIMGEGQSQTFSAHSKNISLSGMLIETDTRFDVGMRIMLELPIKPEGDKVSIQGEIVRMARDIEGEKYLLGVRFIEADEEQGQAITNYLDRNIPKPKNL
jgi:CheY-like chemotaxis protein